MAAKTIIYGEEARQRVLQPAQHHAHPAGQGVVGRGRRQRPLQVVDHRQEVPDQPLRAEPRHLLAIAGGALLEVLKVGCGPQ